MVTGLALVVSIVLTMAVSVSPAGQSVSGWLVD